MRRLGNLLISCLLLVACSTEPALDIEQLEADALGGDSEAIVQLVGLLGSADSAMADRVYPVVVATGEAAVPVLLNQVQSTNRQVREYVIAALGTLKVNQAIPAISQVLNDSHLQRRYVAAWALGEIGDPVAYRALERAQRRDLSVEVQAEAGWALSRVPRVEAVASWPTRWAAALGQRQPLRWLVLVFSLVGAAWLIMGNQSRATVLQRMRLRHQ